jgi:iron-sulfur cluster assembly protein
MITLTEEAAQKIHTQISKRGKGEGIKIGVRTTGCSGLAYTLEFVDNPSIEDQVFETNGVKVWMEPKAIPYLSGSIMTWEKKGLNEGFEFINPLEKDRCGCGESFRV